MNQKFNNRYRIPSARLQSWDYGKNGAYFITICTKNRHHFFGSIIKNEMQKNDIGEIAMQLWSDIPIHFPYIELGNFIVMPNHVHGILIIDKQHQNVDVSKTDTSKSGGFANEKNPMLNENISRIIRWYKGRCSYEIRKLNSEFNWLSRFYDVIIRDSKRFEIIQTYIEQNPAKWSADKFFKKPQKS